jgi:hypothetical protein
VTPTGAGDVRRGLITRRSDTTLWKLAVLLDNCRPIVIIEVGVSETPGADPEKVEDV